MFGAILAEIVVAFSIFSHGFDSSYFPTTAMQNNVLFSTKRFAKQPI